MEVDKLRSQLDAALKDAETKSILCGKWSSDYEALRADRDALRERVDVLRKALVSAQGAIYFQQSQPRQSMLSMVVVDDTLKEIKAALALPLDA